MSKTVLAANGGSAAISSPVADLFKWPIITADDEEAVLKVLHDGSMSGTDITKQFEKEFGAYIGTRYALGTCNGTEALRAAMWACGVGLGDEIICPSMTYWASAAPALSLGASVNFADIDPDTLCIDPEDIEHRIGPKTKALVIVHYAGHPCDMDRILPIVKKHGIKLIEDVSHAEGSLYKGRMCGSFGDVAAMSMMAGKSFAIGEAGMITTDDRLLYERCICFGHYERTGAPSNYNPVDKAVTDPSLVRFAGAPLGTHKHRMNQMASTLGRVQLKYYPDRIREIQAAMNRFWGLLEDVPGIRPHRIESEGSTMGGWYNARGLYKAEELDGLSCGKFAEAVAAEGFGCFAGANNPLHTHLLFHEGDYFNMGQPTVVAFGQRDVRQSAGSLPVTERIREICFAVPWFKHDRPDVIREYAEAFRKVAEHADEIKR